MFKKKKSETSSKKVVNLDRPNEERKQQQYMFPAVTWHHVRVGSKSNHIFNKSHAECQRPTKVGLVVQRSCGCMYQISWQSVQRLLRHCCLKVATNISIPRATQLVWLKITRELVKDRFHGYKKPKLTFFFFFKGHKANSGLQCQNHIFQGPKHLEPHPQEFCGTIIMSGYFTARPQWMLTAWNWTAET